MELEYGIPPQTRGMGEKSLVIFIQLHNTKGLLKKLSSEKMLDHAETRQVIKSVFQKMKKRSSE